MNGTLRSVLTIAARNRGWCFIARVDLYKLNLGKLMKTILAILLSLSMTATLLASPWRIVNFDKLITQADRTVYMIPPAGTSWVVSPASFDTQPLPGKHLTAWVTTIPQRDDQLIVVGVWDLKEGHVQLPEITIRPGYQLILYINGVDNGEILDTWTRAGIEEFAR
jgi:hypothetical protein